MEQLEQIKVQALSLIKEAASLSELDEIRIRYLGKKGQITEFLKSLVNIQHEQRPLIGQLVNDAKETIQLSIEKHLQQLKAAELAVRLASETIDVSLPGRGYSQGHLHPVTRAMIRIEAYFKQLGFDIVSGQEIETEYYNFDALNIPSHHPARAAHDTFYFESGELLRTHTSPSQIRYLENKRPPLRMIAMGRVYRCDSDLTHAPMFHQLEGLLLDEAVSFADLKGLLKDFLQFFFEDDLAMRFRPSFFPFTEPSAEVDLQCVMCKGKGCRICKNTGWLEVLGCGMVHPAVLQGAGLDHESVRGFAFGMGVDRLAMLRYQINDLRLLFDNDVRFLQQF
ncbi:MAG: phenylalanine--tRNA ligase subunit alpha [Gammaproteobacteria bacterium]|nr:phenylalanine--tRNA ligase subunit alpha [Gammaproteobacteria bacterium]